METLFLKVIEISLSSSLIILLVAILSHFLNKVYTARWKVWVWLVIAVRLLMPFNIELKQPVVQIEAPEVQVTVSQSGKLELMREEVMQGMNTNNAVTDLPPVNHNTEIKRGISLIQAAVILWLSGIAVYILIQCLSYLHFIIEYRRWTLPASEKISAIANDEAKQLGMKQQVQVLQSTHINVAMMKGFIKPVILLPIRDYTEDELHFICCHECVHFKNKDIWIKLISMAATAVHWFNPFVHIMNHALAQDLEIACDSTVVRNKDLEYRKSYNTTILNTIDKKGQSFPLTTAFSQKNNLKQRFKNNLDMKLKKKGRFALCLMITICVVGSGLVACHKTVQEVEPSIEKEPPVQNNGFENVIPYEVLPFGFNEEEYEPIDYDQFKTMIQNNDTVDNIFIRRLDEKTIFKGHEMDWLPSLAQLDLTKEDHQVSNTLPNSVTITVTLDDKIIKFDFTDDRGVIVNDEMMYLQSSQGIETMLANDGDDILTAEHFKLQDVLPFEIKDIESIDITKTHYQQSITANLKNAESINQYMKYVMNKYVRERTDEMRYIGLAGGPRVKAVINLKDGSQVTYVPDGYVTLTIDDIEYNYDYAFDLTDLTLSGVIIQDFEQPYSSDLHGLVGPKYTINNIEMRNHIFSYKVGNDYMHDEYRGLESITPETIPYFKEERLLADIYIDSDLKLYARKNDETTLTEIPTKIIEVPIIPNVPGYEKFMNKDFMKHYQAVLPNDVSQYYVEMVLDWGDGDTVSLISSYVVTNLPDWFDSVHFINEGHYTIKHQGEVLAEDIYTYDYVQKLKDLYLSADSSKMKPYTLDEEFEILLSCEDHGETRIQFSQNGIYINDVKTAPSQELIISINDFLPVENE